MDGLLALTVGVTFAAAVYMLLRRSVIKLIVGLVLLSHGTNLLIFVSAGLTRARSSLIPRDAEVLREPYADPLPQALILTAIVISFGVVAFAAALFYRAIKTLGSGDLDEMTRNEQ